MPRFLRLFLAGLAALPLIAGMVSVARHMPPFAHHAIAYGQQINTWAPIDRHITNIVSAVNFDYRAFDTLGEEFMLLSAVTGVTVLLRGQRGESAGSRPGRLPGRPIYPRSEAAILLGRWMAPLLFLFAIYVGLHAMTTPGGGFQGGVLLASALLLVYLGDSYGAWRRMTRASLFDALEGGGTVLYAVAGFLPMLWGAVYLQNLLPMGHLRSLLSGGLMLILNAGVFCAVAGGFTGLFVEFVEEMRVDEGTAGS